MPCYRFVHSSVGWVAKTSLRMRRAPSVIGIVLWLLVASTPWIDVGGKELEFSSHTIEIDGCSYGITTVQNPNSLLDGQVCFEIGVTSLPVNLSPAIFSAALAICGLVVYVWIAAGWSG